MTRISLILLILMICFSIQAQDENSKDLPTMKLKAKRRSVKIDESKVSLTDTLTYEFKFINEGGIDLIIKEIETSCSCTAPTYSKKVKPNEHGFIKLTTTYGQLRDVGSVYAIIMSNTYQEYDKVSIKLDRNN